MRRRRLNLKKSIEYPAHMGPSREYLGRAALMQELVDAMLPQERELVHAYGFTAAFTLLRTMPWPKAKLALEATRGRPVVRLARKV